MAQERYAVDADAIADFTLRMVGRQSPSGEEGGVAELVKAEMEKLGFSVQTDDWGNITGTIDAGPGPCVVIDSHMDTVGVTDPGAWSKQPWGEIDGSRVYGRGTMDMKGPLAASIYGAASLGDRLSRGRVVVSASVCEELVEGPALVKVAERMKPDFAITCEATSLKLARGQRGRAEIQVKTFGRPTHSSRPDLGINAAQAMVDIIVAFRDIRPPSHPVLGQGILVLTDIMSQPYPGLSVVPDSCVATFDRRTLPGETEESILGPIQQAIARALSGSRAQGEVGIAEDAFTTYAGARVHEPNFAPAWFYDEDADIVRRARSGLQSAGIQPELTHYAFCTNGSGTAGRLGIPTVGFGPGEEALAHRIDEYIEIDELATAARGYVGMSRALLEI